MVALIVLMAVAGGVVIAIVFGLILGWASKKFYVKVDERITEIEKVLPGANCGGCGFPGCSGYAEAIVEKGAPMDKCAPGGSDVAARIAEIMGAEVVEKEPEVAVVLCRGDTKASKERFDYYGVRTCGAASIIGAGQTACTVGCLGFGDCVKACPFGAMIMGEDGLPVVIRHLCKGCGKCVEACPRGVIKLMPLSAKVVVRCRNTDKGAAAKKACSVACIACKKCEKVCKFEAIKVENFLAVIDYEKCKKCGKCVSECPQDVIVSFVKLDKRLFKKEKPKEAA